MSFDYQDFQNQPASEKLTLAILEASKRLIAFTLHSGSIYRLENFDISVISNIKESGTLFNEVQSIDELTPGSYFNDRESKILYLITSDSGNPNSKFLHITFKLFFSNIPINLPHDLNTGFDVFFEPMIKSTSAFGVEIDTINQTSEAIEGSGSLTLFNDQDFWPKNFDKLFFENKSCKIYSYNRSLEASEAKLIFKGLIEKKSFNSTQVQFSLKDQLAELKAPISLSNIEALGLRHSPELSKAKQRMILGKVFGHRLTNLDEANEDWEITGTVSINTGTLTVTGSSTIFTSELSPGDSLFLNGVEYNIGLITSDTSLQLTENYTGISNLVGSVAYLKPEKPKRYMNRVWHIAGHSLRQPTLETLSGSTIIKLFVTSTSDINPDDWIYVGDLGSGELVQVDSVLGNSIINLKTSLNVFPPIGTQVFRPSVQNVRIDDILLVYERDYLVNSTTGILTLNNSAEKNAAPLRQLSTNLTFTSGSRTVTGTALNSTIEPGYLVGCVGQAELFEVMAIDSDTQLTLRQNSTFSDTDKGLYKSFVLDPQNSVLSCDVLGRTDDGNPEGSLLKDVPSVVNQLLLDLGFTDQIDDDSFSNAKSIAYQSIGLVVPSQYSDTQAPTYREVINKLNQSIFGSLIQNEDFKFSCLVLQPDKSLNATRLDESDILKINTESLADKIIKRAEAKYRPKEYDYLVGKDSISTVQKTSETAEFIIQTNRERTFDSVLVNEVDAQRYANRWSFLLEKASSSIKIETKLQAMSLQVGDIIELNHRKLFQRRGTGGTRKLGLVEAVKKTGLNVQLEIVDLSDSFNRVAAINDNQSVWAESNEDQKLYGGYITDSNGLIDNDPDSFGTNLIW